MALSGVAKRDLAKLDIDQLKSRMVQGQVEGKSIYRACAGMGLIYGRSFKAISTLLRGQREILAYLRLPQEVEKRWETMFCIRA